MEKSISRANVWNPHGYWLERNRLARWRVERCSFGSPGLPEFVVRHAEEIALPALAARVSVIWLNILSPIFVRAACIPERLALQ
jgi:hypothetical protein